MSNAIVDQMVKLHMERGTDPHPPSYPIDAEYAAAYDVVVGTLATLRAPAARRTPCYCDSAYHPQGH